MRKHLLLIACLVLMARTTCAQDHRMLRLKFNPGDVYHYSVEVSGTGEMSMRTPESMNVDMESFDVPMDVSMYSEIEVSIVDVDADGTAGMDVFMNRFRMNTGPGMSIDSSDEDEDFPPFLEVLFNEPVVLEVSSDGRVITAEFPQTKAEMDETMSMLFPADLDPADILKRAMFKLPAESVSPGDTWTQAASIPVPMSNTDTIDFSYDFEMKGFEIVKGLDCAVIGISVNEDFSRQLQQMQLPGFSGPEERVTMHFDRLSLDFSGTIYFAWNEGVFIGAEGAMEQDVRGTMTSSSEEDVIGMGMNFIADIKVELK